MFQNELKRNTDPASPGDEWSDLYQHAGEGHCL